MNENLSFITHSSQPGVRTNRKQIIEEIIEALSQQDIQDQVHSRLQCCFTAPLSTLHSHKY